MNILWYILIKFSIKLKIHKCKLQFLDAG